jgi:hypothetical protein
MPFVAEMVARRGEVMTGNAATESGADMAGARAADVSAAAKPADVSTTEPAAHMSATAEAAAHMTAAEAPTVSTPAPSAATRKRIC